MQRYTVYLHLESAPHVSGGTSTHHQERIQLYLQHLVFVKLLLLPVAVVEELELVWVCCGWLTSATAHSNQFPDINKLCNVASCWIYIGILLGAHPVLHISRIKVNARVVEYVAGYCEHRSDISGSMKSRNSLTTWRIICFSRRILIRQVRRLII
jgi:hypothetical protein